jgi:hypothetical protein
MSKAFENISEGLGFPLVAAPLCVVIPRKPTRYLYLSALGFGLSIAARRPLIIIQEQIYD